VTRPPAPRPALAIVLALVVGCGGGQVASPTPLVPASGASATDAAASRTAGPAAASGTPASATQAVAPTAPPGLTARPTRAPATVPTPPPAVSEFPQTWTGSWEDPGTGGAGNLELVLTGRGSDFGGSITMDGTACLAGGVLVGSYDGATIAFTVAQRGTVLEFEGLADDAGITGTFRSECDALDGTWTVRRSSR
jgi:hypothetical protein